MGSTVPLEIDLALTTHHGAAITVKVTVAYPDGAGLYAIAALEELATNTDALYREMADRKDASTLRALKNMARVPVTDHTPSGPTTVAG